MNEKKSLFRRGWNLLWRAADLFRKMLTVAFMLVAVLMIVLLVVGVPAPQVEDNVALVWAPAGQIVERIEQDPRQEILERVLDVPPTQTRLRDLLKTLEYAADDERIAVLMLKLDELGGVGMAQLQELQTALQRFRSTGKRVIAYAPHYSQSSYFLAAQADEVLIDPFGAVFVEGFGLYRNYFKDALDKLQIDMHVFRVGEYKSAVEPFLRNDMSDSARASAQVWLNVLWDAWRREVAEARRLETANIDAYVNGFVDQLQVAEGDAARAAVNAGLVDSLVTREQMRDRVAAVVGRDDEHGSFRQIHHRNYLRAMESRSSDAKASNRIGLIVAQGELIDGESAYGSSGGDTLSRLIEDARRDEDLAALVLRVDSPGGSVYASEQIRRELQLFRDTGRPVIASMSSVAASGGYWIASESDQIWAQETTITGSIGIFGLMPSVYRPLQRLGIHNDGVGTTEWSGAMRLDRPLTPPVRDSIQLIIENGYRRFIVRVAEGRDLTPAEVESVAQGRVWSGKDAEGFRLIDGIGGLRDAAAAAARLAGVAEDDYRLYPVEPPLDVRIRFLDRFSGMLRILIPQSLRSRLTEWQSARHLFGILDELDPVSSLFWLNDPHGAYAHCGCEVRSAARR